MYVAKLGYFPNEGRKKETRKYITYIYEIFYFTEKMYVYDRPFLMPICISTNYWFSVKNPIILLIQHLEVSFRPSECTFIPKFYHMNLGGYKK